MKNEKNDGVENNKIKDGVERVSLVAGCCENVPTIDEKTCCQTTEEQNLADKKNSGCSTSCC